jgi:hypothetical protein
MIELIKNSKTRAEAIKKLYGFDNGKTRKKFENFIVENEIDVSHLRSREIKYQSVIKLCPVCDIQFETKVGGKEERTTCSYSCSNTFFRSGVNNPNFGKLIGNNDTYTHYRTICFHYHKKECIVCGENKIVSVHHYDINHKNNEPKNLVPLCPTHHQYVHSRYQNEIQHIVDNYVRNFEKNILPLYYEKNT